MCVKLSPRDLNLGPYPYTHTPQALILVELPSHQGCVLVININILASLVLILIWHFEMQVLHYNYIYMLLCWYVIIICYSSPYCERPYPGPFYKMWGQTHVNGWSRVIASQNGGSTSYIFPFRLRFLQWSCHLFNYWDK